MSKSILFISHEASRTGAPILLRNLLKWISTNTSIPFHIMLMREGVLVEDFANIAPVSVWKNDEATRSTVTRGAATLLDSLGIMKGWQQRALRTRLANNNIGLIYANTIASGSLVEELSNFNCPVICHVHELEYLIRHHGGCGLHNSFQKIKRHTHHYLAASEAVKRNLIQSHEIFPDQVDVTYGFVGPDCQGFEQSETMNSKIRKELDIPEDSFVIGAAGTIEWRKGPDLFIQLAHKVLSKKLNVPIHFVWVGGKAEGYHFGALEHDIERLGLKAHMHFTGTKQVPFGYFSLFDIFTLVSREDPFPLVMLEAAYLGKPIICFDQAGGGSEFVGDDCGFVVSYLDLESMALKTIELLQSDSLRRRLGEYAAQKVREHHTVEVVAPKILAVIQRFLGEEVTTS
jgi:glycosyltransferase involved in cell wall biosynthesis